MTDMGIVMVIGVVVVVVTQNCQKLTISGKNWKKPVQKVWFAIKSI